MRLLPFSLSAVVIPLLPMIPLLPLLAGAPDPVADTWVGGVDLPNRYLFMVVRFAPGEGPGEGTIQFANRDPSSPIRIDARAADNVRFRLAADGTEYVFEGRVTEGACVGLFFDSGKPDTSFPFRLVPIHRLEEDALERLTGTYQFEGGGRLLVRSVTSGYLRLYDPDAGTFRNFYPASPTRFFVGSDASPDPNAASIEFTADGLEHPDRGTGRRIEPQPAAISWKEQDRTAMVGLPNGATLHLVRVAPGAFVMGEHVDAATAEKAFDLPPGSMKSFEYPGRPTRLTRGFWIGRSEVTNAQFRAFVDEEAYATRSEIQGSGLLWSDGAFKRVAGASWRNPGRAIAPDEPAVMLTWHDANAFCAWLARRTGREFRLPTEAEWEYASRAGAGGLYGFGSDVGQLGDYAWYGGNAGGRPHPVETRRANGWGLFDMHGNVWEWINDWYIEVDPGAPTIDPTGPAIGEERVLRGGSWINGPIDCRAGYRAHDAPTLAEPHFGFRVAATGGWEPSPSPPDR